MADGNVDDSYGDMHRLVLQGMMSAGYLDAKGVKNLFTAACHSLKCELLNNYLIIILNYVVCG
jgi:hypothetical protein